MLNLPPIECDLQGLAPDQLQALFFATYKTSAARLTAIEQMLRGPAGSRLREQIGHWVIQRLPVEELVPEKYVHWRPLVQDAMLFMFLHLSVERLAPKLVEQLELPPDIPTGERLLRLIAKVPGLQKLGQVLARNRNLLPALRQSLTELENGICDMHAREVRTIVMQELGPRLRRYSVRLKPGIFSEASVSAVLRFTWGDPDRKRRRERGVLKVMKPYIPTCFAEDMELLAQLAKHVERKHREYGFARRVLPETFSDVRQLLQHEVDFSREQATLQEAFRAYGTALGVRVPRLIQPLCTAKITAMTEEHGVKVTDAAAHMPGWRRAQLSELLVEAFLAVPLFSSEKDAMFHADPHAGNLLYDERNARLVILDWALTERVSREQRRHLAMLFFMTALRDPDGICRQIQAISRGGVKRKASQTKMVRECVNAFIERLPLTRVPGATDTLELLENIAFKGVRLPAPLIMLRKVLFTLDGVQHDIGGPEINMLAVLARYATPRWLTSWSAFGAPLSLRDWLAVQSSTLSYGKRMWKQGAQALLSRSRAAAHSA